MTPHPHPVHTTPPFTYESGQKLFRPRDPDRTPLTVQTTTYSPCGRHIDVVLQHPHQDKPVLCRPHHLAHINEALRPTLAQLTDAIAHTAHAIDTHTDHCSLCKRTRTWWGTAQRCLTGKRMIDTAIGLSYYRDNVLPHLTGNPVDPARLHPGQDVTIHTDQGHTLDARIATSTATGEHPPGHNGQILVHLLAGTSPVRVEESGPVLYPAPWVYHRP